MCIYDIKTLYYARLRLLTKADCKGVVLLPTASASASVSTRPPIDSCLNLYDFEAVAKHALKLSAFNYYATASTDEFTKQGNQAIFRYRGRVGQGRCKLNRETQQKKHPNVRTPSNPDIQMFYSNVFKIAHVFKRAQLIHSKSHYSAE